MATILESFVGKFLLNKLVNFVEDEVVMGLGVKDELKKLERRMRRVGAYLTDAERRRISDESINIWLNELKDVMYDVDNMIDLWRYNNNTSPTENPSSSANSPTCCPRISCFGTIKVRRDIARQIKTLNARLMRIFEDMTNLNLQNIQGEVRQLRRVDAHMTTPVIGVDIVGNEIEEGAKKLVKLASINNEKEVKLIAITGMGGIGKTTLAQKVYNNQTIENRYAIRMWLHISQNFSPSQLIKEAIRNAGGKPGRAERESELLPILANVVSGKSFFLVLDDAWNPDLWVNLLQDPLKANATQGFVLVTTRDQTVAMQMGATHIHQSTILSANSGWELLCKRAYLTNTIDIQNLTEVGVKIVKKCGGLPLAIKAIAGVLATKSKTKSEWDNLLNNNTWSTNGLPKEIDRALYLSYEDLSPQLKQCFLYCSLYPSNWRMYYRDIVECWIAEGFIEENEDQIIEDIAEECYYELMRRHLLEPEPLFADHSRCRMHDLLRSLAQYLSKGESFHRDQVSLDVNKITSLRRLLITETKETVNIPGPTEEPLKLRTFRISKCLSEIEGPMFRRLKYLRILIINGTGLQNIPDLIGDLIHLRELDLDRTSISKLPESIGSLKNLLFLKLESCKLLCTLPRGVTRLCNLRHLKLQDTPLTSVPKGLGKLQKLTQVTGFQVGGDSSNNEVQNGWDLQELEGLFELRRIRINKLERATNNSGVLETKTHLKELILNFSKVLECSGHVAELEYEKSRKIVEKLCPAPCLEELVIQNYGGNMLPSWMSSSSLGDFLPNLQYLILTNWSCCTDLPPLGMLSNLKYLKVKGASSIVRINFEFLAISVRNGPNLAIVFPKLEHLFLEDMPNWKEWVIFDFEGGNSTSWQLMPRIKELVINKCPQLRALPNGLQKLLAVDKIIVKEAHSIKSIQNLTLECEHLEVYNNNSLQTISNISGVKRLIVGQCHNLRQVTKMNSVEYIKLLDYAIERLPNWLVKLTEEIEDRLEHKLHLDMFCKTTLLERCLKSGIDWHIIGSFSSVSVYNKKRNASMEYTKEPESYFQCLESTITKVKIHERSVPKGANAYTVFR